MRKPFILSVSSLFLVVKSCICIFNITCNDKGLSPGIKSKKFIPDPLVFSANFDFKIFKKFGDTLGTERKDRN